MAGWDWFPARIATSIVRPLPGSGISATPGRGAPCSIRTTSGGLWLERGPGLGPLASWVP